MRQRLPSGVKRMLEHLAAAGILLLFWFRGGRKGWFISRGRLRLLGTQRRGGGWNVLRGIFYWTPLESKCGKLFLWYGSVDDTRDWGREYSTGKIYYYYSKKHNIRLLKKNHVFRGRLLEAMSWVFSLLEKEGNLLYALNWVYCPKGRGEKYGF